MAAKRVLVCITKRSILPVQYSPPTPHSLVSHLNARLIAVRESACPAEVSVCVLRQVASDPILPLEDVRLTLLPNISGVAGLHVNSAGNCRYKNYPTDETGESISSGAKLRRFTRYSPAKNPERKKGPHTLHGSANPSATCAD